jgi:hypothetical protein
MTLMALEGLIIDNTEEDDGYITVGLENIGLIIRLVSSDLQEY